MGANLGGLLKLLPIGVTGLVLAGLVAAIMSSIDSTLNSASTLIIHDFVTSPDRQPTERELRNGAGLRRSA